VIITQGNQKISNKVEYPKIDEKPKESKSEDEPTTDANQIHQFISRFFNGKLLTEEIIREGLGYATTSREKEIAEKRDAKNKKKMNEIMNLALKLNLNSQKPISQKQEQHEASYCYCLILRISSLHLSSKLQF